MGNDYIFFKKKIKNFYFILILPSLFSLQETKPANHRKRIQRQATITVDITA